MSNAFKSMSGDLLGAELRPFHSLLVPFLFLLDKKIRVSFLTDRHLAIDLVLKFFISLLFSFLLFDLLLNFVVDLRIIYLNLRLQVIIKRQKLLGYESAHFLILVDIYSFVNIYCFLEDLFQVTIHKFMGDQSINVRFKL